MARFDRPGQLVDIGGTRLHLHCEGSGRPVVVLDAGLSSSSFDWSALQPEIAKRTRVCAYDRAGYGFSEEGPPPRDSQRLVQELHAVLAKAKVPPPFVLVGHSFGGLNVRLFTYEHPSQVVGLVLVDPSHEDQLSSFPRSAAPRYEALLKQNCRDVHWSRLGAMRLRGRTAADTTSVPPDRQALVAALGYQTKWFRTVCEERKAMWTTSAEQLRVARRPLAIPVVVLDGNYTMGADSVTAGYSPEDAALREAAWHRLHRELAAISPGGRLVVADRSGHNVHIDQPELVLAAISQVVAEVRGSEE